MPLDAQFDVVQTGTFSNKTSMWNESYSRISEL